MENASNLDVVEQILNHTFNNMTPLQYVVEYSQEDNEEDLQSARILIKFLLDEAEEPSDIIRDQDLIEYSLTRNRPEIANIFRRRI